MVFSCIKDPLNALAKNSCEPDSLRSGTILNSGAFVELSAIKQIRI